MLFSFASGFRSCGRQSAKTYRTLCSGTRFWDGSDVGAHVFVQYRFSLIDVRAYL